MPMMTHCCVLCVRWLPACEEVEPLLLVGCGDEGGVTLGELVQLRSTHTDFVLQIVGVEGWGWGGGCVLLWGCEEEGRVEWSVCVVSKLRRSHKDLVLQEREV